MAASLRQRFSADELLFQAIVGEADQADLFQLVRNVQDVQWTKIALLAQHEYLVDDRAQCFILLELTWHFNPPTPRRPANTCLTYYPGAACHSVRQDPLIAVPGKWKA
jgi:hypothetical protein